MDEKKSNEYLNGCLTVLGMIVFIVIIVILMVWGVIYFFKNLDLPSNF